MDDWGWEQVEPWRQLRAQRPVGPLLCVIHGPTCGRAWSQTGARAELRRLAAIAGGAGASLRISSATPTLSRWPAKECRSGSSNVSSVTRTVG